MRRIALKIEYDGTDFYGFQLQPDVRTVQGRLEAAAERVTQAPSRVQGGSRTDSGAHAQGQVAHFDTASELPCGQIVRAMNYYLPEDAAVLDAQEVPEDFHSCFDAQSKVYRYRVVCSPVPHPLRRKRVLRTHHALDPDLLHRCAELAGGTRDFASFGSETDQYDTTERTLIRSEWRRREDELHYVVEGDGFLYKMVRTLVGTMIDVARGKYDIEAFRNIFDARDRRQAGQTAPAHALTLVSLHYDEPLFEGVSEHR